MARATSVSEVGPGDYVKVREGLKEIHSNSAFHVVPPPRQWVVTTTDGRRYGMWDIYAYVKKRDAHVER